MIFSSRFRWHVKLDLAAAQKAVAQRETGRTGRAAVQTAQTVRTEASKTVALGTNTCLREICFSVQR